MFYASSGLLLNNIIRNDEFKKKVLPGVYFQAVFCWGLVFLYIRNKGIQMVITSMQIQVTGRDLTCHQYLGNQKEHEINELLKTISMADKF